MGRDFHVHLESRFEEGPEGSGGRGVAMHVLCPGGRRSAVLCDQMCVRVCINMHLHTSLIETTKNHLVRLELRNVLFTDNFSLFLSFSLFFASNP